jgi:hypothetical protein
MYCMIKENFPGCRTDDKLISLCEIYCALMVLFILIISKLSGFVLDIFIPFSHDLSRIRLAYFLSLLHYTSSSSSRVTRLNKVFFLDSDLRNKAAANVQIKTIRVHYLRFSTVFYFWSFYHHWLVLRNHNSCNIFVSITSHRNEHLPDNDLRAAYSLLELSWLPTAVIWSTESRNWIPSNYLDFFGYRYCILLHIRQYRYFLWWKQLVTHDLVYHCVVCGDFLPFGYYDLYFPAQATNNYYIRWDA